MRELTTIEINHVSAGLGTGVISGAIAGAASGFICTIPFLIMGFGSNPGMAISKVIFELAPYVLGPAVLGALIGEATDLLLGQNS